MYFNELESKHWALKDAMTKYTIRYKTQELAKAKIIQHLNQDMKNPNLKKACKDDCRKMLDKLELKPACEKPNKTQQTASNRRTSTSEDIAESSSSRATNTGAAAPTVTNNIGQFNNNKGTVNLNAISNNQTVHTNKKRRLIEDINPQMDEIDNLLNNAEEVEENEEIAPAFLKLQKGIKISNPKIHLVINNINLTTKFMAYQEQCINIANESGFVLETHAHEVLMLSSVLIVKPNQHSDFMLQHFEPEQLDLLRKHVLKSICGCDHLDIEFDQSAVVAITKIMKNLSRNKIAREEAIDKVLELKPGLNSNESRIVDSLVNLLQKLPTTRIVDQLGELELACGYIDPVVFPIFTNYNASTKLVWPNLIQKESKAAHNDVNSSRRPDAVMRILHQHNYSEARGFGEIKTAERLDENYELVKDLVRCCIFSKESIDINDMKGNLFFQVVGFKIGFYYFSLAADGIYTAVEICSLEIPSSLETMAMFITQLDDLLLVSTIYEKGCNKHEKPEIYHNMKRETLDSPTFHSYLDKRKSKFNRRTLIF